MISYAYLHGFASGPLAYKGRALAGALAERGLELHLPDLNRPSFARLTVTGALEAVSELVRRSGSEHEWRFVGSSFGGYLAARWAEQHPGRVGRLLLLCPGFDLRSRWPEMLGEEAMREWRRRGVLDLPDGAGRPTGIHWGFYADLQAHPPIPEPVCPTLVMHGTRDEVVPIGSSRRWARGRSTVQLVELDDDHGLHASLPTIEEQLWRFLVGG